MLDQVYLRYVAASAVSLGIDFTIFMGALSVGVAPALAAACGYLAGIVAHWFVSSRAVFVGHVADAGASRWHQQAMFLLSALVGLGITSGIVGLGSWYGLDPRLAKLVAVAASFQATYVLRRKVVFA
jgi:putative flippase GtrA